MARVETNPGVPDVRRRDLWQMVGVIVAAFALATTIFSLFIVPAVILRSRSEWRDDMQTAIRPVVERIDRIETKLDRVAEQR